MYRGRFAPSPTGDLHLGSAACALIGWLRARSQQGAFIIRVEDIDSPRVEPGAQKRQLEDLRWLGLDWDEGPDCGGPSAPYLQSARRELYDGALRELARQGRTYFCDCSRADIARAASAPHVGDEGPRYPGTCRAFGMSERAWKRPPAVRLLVPETDVAVSDLLQGDFVENVQRCVGDFVLRRGDGIYAYQLAVVVDDLAMGITEVVRGADLLGSTARQVLLAKLLGHRAPRYAHHPMLVSPDGSRLAKRKGSRSLSEHRQAGVTAGALTASLAAALGVVHAGCAAASPYELLATFDWDRMRGLSTVRFASP